MPDSFDDRSELYFKIGQEVPEDNVNIAYFEVPELSPDTNVQLIDESLNIYANVTPYSHEIVKALTNREHELSQLEDKETKRPSDYEQHSGADLYPSGDNNYEYEVIMEYEELVPITVPDERGFFVTDVTTGQDSTEGEPLFFRYQLRYPHIDRSDADREQIDGNIEVLDSDMNSLSSADYPYTLRAEKIEDIEHGLALYEVELLMEFNTTFEDTFYVRYRADNDIALDYVETVNAEPIFREALPSEVIEDYAGDPEKKYYTLAPTHGGYNILVPIRAKQDKEDYHNVLLDTHYSLPFDYTIDMEGMKKGEAEGVVVAFSIDESGSMNWVDERIENAENGVNYVVDYITSLVDDDELERCYFYINYFSSSVREDYDGRFMEEIEADIDAGGATAMYTGLEYAIEAMDDPRDADGNSLEEEFENMKQVIIVMGDGAGNRPDGKTSPSDYQELNDRAHDIGVDEVYAIGVGDLIDPDQLQAIADSDEHYNSGDDDDTEDMFESVADGARPVPFDINLLSGTDYATPERRYVTDIPTSPPEHLDPISAEVSVEKSAPRPDGEQVVFIEGEDWDKEPPPLVDLDEPIVVKDLDGDIEDARNLVMMAYSTYENELWSRQYYIKQDFENSRIFAQLPHNLVKEENWHIDVYNGHFVTTDKDGRRYFYSIPEFDLTYPEDGVPVGGEEPHVAGRRTVQTRRYPLYFDIEIRDGVAVPDNINLHDRYDDTEMTVVDWDKEKGVLHTEENIAGRDLLVDYSYEPRWYEYHGYDGGEHGFVSLNLNPHRGHYYTSIDPYAENPEPELTPTSELFHRIVYLYIVPEYVTDSEGDIIRGSRRQDVLFHTVGEPVRSSHLFIEEDIYDKELYTLDDVLLLARIYITPTTDMRDLALVDTRSRGGGIKERFVDELREIHPDADYFWDIGDWDGEAYPSNAVVVIELPEEVLEQLTHDEILERVEKQVGFGVLPVIRYV